MGRMQIEPSEVRGHKEQPTPAYYCRDCARLSSDCTCAFFQRRVEPNFNRCFYHSFYSPVSATFRAPDNLEQIILENEMKEIA